MRKTNAKYAHKVNGPTHANENTHQGQLFLKKSVRIRGNPIADLGRALVTRKGWGRETSQGAKNLEYGEKK